MDDTIKLGILSMLLGVGAAAVDAMPTPPAPAPVRGGKRKAGKLGGCTPCQGRADANATLRESAKMVGLASARAIPKGGI